MNHSEHSEKTRELEGVEHTHSEAVGHEVSEINISSVYKFLGWLAVLMVFSYFLVFGIIKWNEARIGKVNSVMTHIAKTKNDQLPPEPRLQLAPGHAIHPLDEGIQYRDSVSKALESYGYVNQATGTVHIPIDLAKDLLLKKGLPVRAQQSDASESAIMLPEFSSSGRTVTARDQRIPGGTYTITGGNLSVQNKQ